MSFFKKHFWFSSQRAPDVKEEARSDGNDPEDEINTGGGRQKIEESADGEAGQIQFDDVWDGTEGAEARDGEMNSSRPKADKGKKKQKKGKKKKKRMEAAETAEDEGPQLGKADIEQDKSLLDGAGEHSGQIEESVQRRPIVAEPLLEEPVAEQPIGKEIILKEKLKSKRTRTVNGTAPKRKRTPKSKLMISPEEDFDENALVEETTPGLRGAASQSHKTNKQFQPRLSNLAVEIPYHKPEAFSDKEVEPSARDLSQEELSELPRRIKKTKKSKRRRISNDPSSRSSDDETTAVIRQSPSSSSIPDVEPELDNQEEPSDASSRRQREALVITSLKPVVSEDSEDEAPKQPSKKALGKRKAVDESSSRGSSKKPNRGKDRRPAGQDLRGFGFISEHRSSVDSLQISSLQSKIGEIAAKIYEETHGRPAEAKATSKSKLNSSTWNAVNNSVSSDDGHDSNGSRFVSDTPGPSKVASVSSVRKGRLPVDGPGPSNSTPTTKFRPTVTPKANTPKVTEQPAKLPRATSTRSKLSKEELDAITSAVNSYREQYNLSEYQIKELVQSDAQKAVARDMWTAICEEVPDIPRRSVQNTCRRKFHNFDVRGVWTEEQDEELRRAYEKNPQKWKLIGETLHRFPEDVRDRWRNYLVCGNTLKKDAWDIEEEERLRTAVKQCIQETQKVHRLKGGKSLADPESLIDWQNVSERMGHTRSRLQCRNKWHKLIDREEKNADDPTARMPISSSWRLEKAALEARLFSSDEKLALLRAIRDTGAAREGKIPWQALQKDLDGEGKRMAWKYCFRKLKDHVTDHENMEFKDIVAHLVDVFETAAPDDPEGFDIPISVSEPKKRRKTDNEEQSSTSRLGADRKRKQNQSRDSDDGAEEVSAVKRRRVRDRMLKEGESQETTNNHSEAIVGIGEDVAQSFEFLRQIPKTKCNRVIRNSKRNKALSAEKIVESSDDEEVMVNGHTAEEADDDEGNLANRHTAERANDNEEALVNGHVQEDEEEDTLANGHATEASEDEIDVDDEEGYTITNGQAVNHTSDDESIDENKESEGQEKLDDEMEVDVEETYTTTGGPAADYDSDEASEKIKSESEDDRASIYDRKNTYYHEGSPDLDKHARTKSHKISFSPPPHTNGYHEDDHGSVSSDDGYMSDIPARRQQRVESPEL